MSTINEDLVHAAIELAHAKRLVVKAGKLALKAGADAELLGRLAALTIELDEIRSVLDPGWAAVEAAAEQACREPPRCCQTHFDERVPAGTPLLVPILPATAVTAGDAARAARRARAASFDASGEHQEDGVQSANPEFPE